MMGRPQRRLAAILAADVAGYSRLIASDQAGTLAELRALRRELFEPRVAAHRGEVVKRMGDGWLIEFTAVADAIACATELQDTLPQRSHIRLRMGLHLGDVTHEDEDLFGDGINIAARLQALAAPGELWISDDCARQLDAKTRRGFHDLGAQDLKNIDKPVRALRYGAETASTSAPATVATAPPYPTLRIADFQTVGATADFATGLASELRAAMGHIRWIAITENVGAGAGRTYELSGTLRIAEDRVRVTYRLLDPATGRQLFSHQLASDVGDAYGAHERLSNEISCNVESAVLETEKRTIEDAPSKATAAWRHFILGYEILRRGDLERMDEAISELERSVADGPVVPRALSLLAAAYVQTGHLLDHDNADAHFATGKAYAERCLDLDSADVPSLAFSIFAHQMQGRMEDARVRASRLARLAPTQPLAVAAVGVVHLWDDDFEIALQHFDRAIACGRYEFFYYWFLQWRAIALYMLGDYAACLRTARECVLDHPRFSGGHRYVGLALAQLGQIEEARQALKIARQLGTVTAANKPAFMPERTWLKILDGLSKADFLH